MTADWIKMRGNLWSDPRVSRLCDLTDESEATIIGALYWLWSSADQHSEDGAMPGLTTRGIDRKTSVQGFGEALLSIGWISQGEDGIVIERFCEHNGSTAKKRMQTARRVAKNAERKKQQSANAPSVSDALATEDRTNAGSVSNALAEYDEFALAPPSTNKAKQDASHQSSAEHLGDKKRGTQKAQNGDTNAPSVSNALAIEHPANAPSVSDALGQRYLEQEQEQEQNIKPLTPVTSAHAPATTANGKFSSEHYELATQLAHATRANHPSIRINLSTWAEDIRKLNEIDGHSLSAIAKLWGAICEHRDGEFSWAENCRSPGKLRKVKDGLPYFAIIYNQLFGRPKQGGQSRSSGGFIDHHTDTSWAAGL